MKILVIISFVVLTAYSIFTGKGEPAIYGGLSCMLAELYGIRKAIDEN